MLTSSIVIKRACPTKVPQSLWRLVAPMMIKIFSLWSETSWWKVVSQRADLQLLAIHLVKSKVKVLPAPMAHREVPISVSVALCHASANAVKATAVGWSTGSSACITFPLHSFTSSARREGSEYHLKVFGMTWPGLEPTTYRL